MDNSAVNSNTVVMTYSKQSDTKTVKFNTFDVNLKKTDDTESSYDSTTGESTSPKTLAGAKFKVYTAATGGTALKFKKDATGYYVDATGEAEIDAGEGTGVNIRGFEPGTFYLEETVAPVGYNKLSSRQSFTVVNTATAALDVTVKNVDLEEDELE